MDNDALSLVEWIPRCYFRIMCLSLSFIVVLSLSPSFQDTFLQGRGCSAAANSRGVLLFSCESMSIAVTMLYQCTSVHLVGLVAWNLDSVEGCCPGQKRNCDHAAGTLRSIAWKRAASRDCRDLLWGQRVAKRALGSAAVWNWVLNFKMAFL